MSFKKSVIQFFFAVFLIILINQCAYAVDLAPVGQSKSRSSSIPTGQSKGKAVSEDEGISGDIFGRKGGRFHPFIILEEVYTDNLFATNTNKKEDFITTIAPGIWLAFPANRQQLLSINTTTTSPGGLKLSRIKPEATRRYQTYFLYSPEFVFYKEHSQHDHVNHRAEALLQYNFNSGLSLDVIDLYHDREEIAGNGVVDTLYQYQDNLLDFIISYAAPSGKFKMELDFSNYDIEYEESIVLYRNRNDNSFNISLFYKFWPKTSLFAEYNFSDIEFDSVTIYDSTENRYYAGINWDITAKTRGTIKLGYTDKDFDLAGIEDLSEFSLELQTQHNLTPKRALQINGYRKFHESDFGSASSFLSTGIDVGLMQRFNDKWSGNVTAIYEENRYYGFERDDELFGVGLALRFKPRKWLFFDAGYNYYQNDSNINAYDYEVNQLFFRISLLF